MLTFACRRASKLREEGRAHFSLGVLRDNLGQYLKAIEAYTQFLGFAWIAFISQFISQLFGEPSENIWLFFWAVLSHPRFLRVCKECNDSQGAALGYHCIAVDYQLQGSGVTKEAEDKQKSGATEILGSPSEKTIKPELLRKAIYYHNRHRENADSIGKFVAHLNMGLAYAQLGEREASTVNHQYALRYALQLHSLEGQSLAIGSLSFSAGMYDQEPDKMKILVERYVDLCGVLKQTRNQAVALKKLGILASQQGQNEQSIEYFQQAIECARAQGDLENSLGFFSCFFSNKNLWVNLPGQGNRLGVCSIFTHVFVATQVITRPRRIVLFALALLPARRKWLSISAPSCSARSLDLIERPNPPWLTPPKVGTSWCRLHEGRCQVAVLELRWSWNLFLILQPLNA